MEAESLRLDEIGEDPITVFTRWYEEAKASEPNDPGAVALASVDATGLPDVRMVLLKAFDQRGFVFYTNFESAKGRELTGTPKAAMCFHWKTLRRQVRARGAVGIVSQDEADAYFASRPRVSRLGAWASAQSRPLDRRATLESRVAEIDATYSDDDLPRPAHWSGFRLLATELELWSDGAFRLHDRFRFTRPTVSDPWP